MSYNIAIVIPPVSDDDKAAWRVIDEHINEGGLVPDIFLALHKNLTKRYPCLCSMLADEVENCVWSDGPLINNFMHRAAVLGMSYSRFSEALPFVIQTANAMGLVVFDWSGPRIYRP